MPVSQPAPKNTRTLSGKDNAMRYCQLVGLVIAAGTVAGCHHRASSSDYSSPNTTYSPPPSSEQLPPRRTSSDMMNPSPGAYPKTDAQQGTVTANPQVNPPVVAQPAAQTSPETRILSILHAKDLEEIKLGQLAAQNGSSDAIRNYGQNLVRDHTDHDAKVPACASSIGVRLMEPSEFARLQQRETGKAAADPAAELRDLTGSDFDHAFATKMRDGHTEAIQAVQSAQASVTNAEVKDLLTATLPTLQEH